MRQKVREEGNVIPFTGILQPQQTPPPPQPNLSAINPAYFTLAVLLFAVGLSIGAISVHQSAGYQQLEQLKARSAELSKVKEAICK